MNFDLNSAIFGIALSAVCTGGLFGGLFILFQMMESLSRNPNHYTRPQRVRRYLIATALLIGQMVVAVALLYKFSYLLANTASWGAGLAVGIFAFSLVLLPFFTQKK